MEAGSGGCSSDRAKLRRCWPKDPATESQSDAEIAVMLQRGRGGAAAVALLAHHGGGGGKRRRFQFSSHDVRAGL